MITGTVMEFQARVGLRIRGSRKKYESIEAIVDTGFNGWLSLPPQLIAGLGLRWKTDGRGVLADGTESRFDVYEGTIQWHRRPNRILVISAETVPLIGMALLAESELTIRVRQGGPVRIRPLRRR